MRTQFTAYNLQKTYNPVKIEPSDGGLFKLFRKREELLKKLSLNDEIYKKAQSSLPDFAKISGWPELPANLDYFYPQDREWQFALTSWNFSYEGRLSEKALHTFNYNVGRKALKPTSDEIENLNQLFKDYDWEAREEYRVHYEEIASFSQQRLDWFNNQVRLKKEAEESVNLPNLIEISEQTLAQIAEVEMQIISVRANTSGGLKAKADLILQDAEMMSTNKTDWEFRVVESLVLDIKNLV